MIVTGATTGFVCEGVLLECLAHPAVLGWFYPMLKALFPKRVLTMREVGLAMIQSVLVGAPKRVLEVEDMVLLAATAEPR